MTDQNEADVEIAKRQYNEYKNGKRGLKQMTFCPECLEADQLTKLQHKGGCVDCPCCFLSACG